MKKVPIALQRKRLKKKAEDLIHLWIRKKATNFQGYAECYTCKRMVLFEQIQAGHRWHGKLDLSEDNLKPQCSQCNNWKHGNLGLYERYLIEDYGLEWAKELESRAAKDKGEKDIEVLKGLIVIYENKLKKTK